MLAQKSLRLALFIATMFVFAPRLSHSQSACIESLILNATVCYWDASNHSTIATPAIVGLTVLPLLHPNRALLFASLNGGAWIALSSGAAAVPVPAAAASLSCDSECSGVASATDGARCCSMVIDVWIVTHAYRTNLGCSLYFTVPVHASAAALPPVFKFHGEINAGLQVSPPLHSSSSNNNNSLYHHLPNLLLLHCTAIHNLLQRTRDTFRLCMSVLFVGSSYPGICLAAAAPHFFSVISAPADLVRRACVTLPPVPGAAFGSHETVSANM